MPIDCVPKDVASALAAIEQASREGGEKRRWLDAVSDFAVPPASASAASVPPTEEDFDAIRAVMDRNARATTRRLAGVVAAERWRDDDLLRGLARRGVAVGSARSMAAWQRRERARLER